MCVNVWRMCVSMCMYDYVTLYVRMQGVYMVACAVGDASPTKLVLVLCELFKERPFTVRFLLKSRELELLVWCWPVRGKID